MELSTRALIVCLALTLAAPSARGAAPENGTPLSCPAKLAMNAGTRSIDTRSAPVNSRGSRLSALHGLPVSYEQLLSDEEALARIEALEKKHPGLLPAGFRDRAQAHPRDVELRLEMARCELGDKGTLRRASYDAAIAVLLGAPLATAVPLLKKSAYPEDSSTTCERHSDCGGDGWICDPRHKVCASPEEQAVVRASALELEEEDLVMRAFIRRFLAAEEDSPEWKDLGLFTLARLVRCGDSRCRLTRYQAGKRPLLVYWDIRDGGGSASMSFAQLLKSLTPKQRTCMERTGAVDFEQCRWTCRSGDRRAEEACIAECGAACK